MKFNKTLLVAAALATSTTAFGNTNNNATTTVLATAQAELQQAISADFAKIALDNQRQISRTATQNLQEKVEFLLIARTDKDKKGEQAE